MDPAYEGDETRQLVLDMGMIPVVPPKSNRVDPWAYDRSLYTKRNEIERLFRRLKGFRRIFSRFEKLDVLFLRFLNFALIARSVRELRTNRLLPSRTKLRSFEVSQQSVEQDHRGIKSRTRVMPGFKNFQSAATTIAGIELLRRIHKDQFALGRLRLRNQATPTI